MTGVSPLPVSMIDHVAITVADLDRSFAFYRDLLGARLVREMEIDGRVAVRQIRLEAAMLNLHRPDHRHPLVARKPTPGAADLCFRWAAPIGDAEERLRAAGLAVEEGPVPRYAANGVEGRSLYFRDPDGNLLEFLSIEESA